LESGAAERSANVLFEIKQTLAQQAMEAKLAALKLRAFGSLDASLQVTDPLAARL
jgi:hypothetical protein